MFMLKIWLQTIPGRESRTDLLIFKENIKTIVSCKKKINRFIKFHGNTIYAEVRRFKWHTKHKDFNIVAQYHCIYGWKGLLHPDNYKNCTHR